MGGDNARAVKLIPYLADTSAGVGTLVIVTRLPGFTGPNPSTSLDKVIQLLAAIVGRWGGGCQARDIFVFFALSGFRFGLSQDIIAMV